MENSKEIEIMKNDNEKNTNIEPERVFVTGAAGMIGQAIIRLCVEKKIEVVATLRPGSKSNERVMKNELVTYVECDMKDLENVYERLDEKNNKCDIFVHLAWGGTRGGDRNLLYSQVDNIKYTLDAVGLASKLGCKAFCGTGSQAEFGRVADNTKLSAKIPANPETGYGIAKLCAGKLSKNMCSDLGIKHVWVRILSAYGPYDSPGTMVMSAIIAMSKGDRGKFTKGEQMWDYVYCDDVADAILSAATKGKDGAVYCIGSGKVRPMKDYITDIKDVVAPDLELIFGEIDYYNKQVMYLCADISDLTRDTGFEPKVAFKEGVERTAKWYENICK